jgi:hypothetical protein
LGFVESSRITTTRIRQRLCVLEVISRSALQRPIVPTGSGTRPERALEANT